VTHRALLRDETFENRCLPQQKADIREGAKKMVNRVVLVGRLVADPEMKFTPQGVAVASMRIAVNRMTKNEQGEYEADFFNVTAWRRTAEFASTYLGKGRLVSIDGRLRTRSWVAQDGTRRSVVEIEAENIEGLDRKQDSSGEVGHSSEDYESAPVTTPTPARTSSKPTRQAAPPPAADNDLDDADPFADE
jgi:single-strand DNA-binding protein